MINDNEIGQAESLKLLRVLLNENLCCKELIKDNENSYKYWVSVQDKVRYR